MEQPSETYTLKDLQEGIAKRKVVVRKGKRKVLGFCAEIYGKLTN
jgi:hypothetical protein